MVLVPMEEIPLLSEIAAISTVSVLVTVLLGKLHLPTVTGLILSGVLMGPNALGWVSDVHAIQMIAEVGVVFLLFTIGLEFSLSRLRNIFQQVALGGLVQVGLTTSLIAAAAIFFGVEPRPAVFIGFVFALSSTAMVLRTLNERRELDAPHGRFIVGTLIFQDLCVVPMVLLVPLLAGDQGGSGLLVEITTAMGIAILVVVTVLSLSRFILPRVFRWVDAENSREIFLLAVVAICVGTAWLTSQVGLSLALGAFLGGIILADTEYSHRAMSDMLPLRDAFVSIFFISLGMFFDVAIVQQHPVLVLGFLVAFVFGKGLIATLSAMVMRFPARVAWLAGAGLAQFGEFGFVLIQLGRQEGVLPMEQLDPLLNAGIISMIITPLLVRLAPHVTAGERILEPLEKLLGARGIDQFDTIENTMSDHVVVIGYGLAGRMITDALQANHISVVALELNAENVRAGRRRGDPVYYADATSLEALGHAHLNQARAVVILINDRAATLRVLDSIRRLTTEIPVFVRGHYLGEGQHYLNMGATEFVAGEVESGLEILNRVLGEMGLSSDVIEHEIDCARQTTHTSRQQHALQTLPPSPARAER